jgi:hypothetical protein
VGTPSGLAALERDFEGLSRRDAWRAFAGEEERLAYRMPRS